MDRYVIDRMASSPEHRLQMFIFFAFLSIVLIGCEEPFEPLMKSDEASFSFFGFLDASADTQWVRATPVREQLDMPPEKLEMTVTLKHLESGHTEVLKDSLLELSFPGDFNILNAWTTMKLEPGQSYRLKGERPDGATSNVTVTLPEDFPTPRLRVIEGASDILYFDRVDRLADVQVVAIFGIRWAGMTFNRIRSAPYRNQVEQIASEEYRVRIHPIRNPGILPANAVVESSRLMVFVASGGPEWNSEIDSLDDLNYALPEVNSNVEGGVGYVVGIVSKSIPYQSCFDEESNLVACPEVKLSQ